MQFDIPPLLYDIVLFLARLLLAIAFAVSARNKFRDMRKFATENGMPLPVSYVVAVAEIAAALGLASGVLAQWAAVGLMALMLGTMSLHIFKWHSPYWANKGGWEYDLMLFVFAAVIALYGPGRFALSLFL